MKKIFRILPLVYFMGLAIFWFLENYMATGTINYIALAVLLGLSIELFYNSKIVGLLTGSAMSLFSAYMLLAMLSDIFKGGAFNPNMVPFLVFGTSLFGVGLLMGIILIVYHAKQSAN